MLPKEEKDKEKEKRTADAISEAFLKDNTIPLLICKNCQRVPLITLQKIPLEEPKKPQEEVISMMNQEPTTTTEETKTEETKTEAKEEEIGENKEDKKKEEVHTIKTDAELEELDNKVEEFKPKYKYQIKQICSCQEKEKIFTFEEFWKEYPSLAPPSNNCKNHEGVDATKFCQQCKEFFCAECEKTHTAENPEEHIMTFIKYNTQETCKIHNNEKCDLFCDDCKIPICSQCMNEEHDKHHTSDLDKYLTPEVIDQILREYDLASTLALEKNKKLKEKIVNKLDQIKNEVETSFNHYFQVNQNILNLEKALFKSYQLCPTSGFAMSNLVVHSDFSIHPFEKAYVMKDNVIDIAQKATKYFKEGEVLRVSENSGKTNWLNLIKEVKINTSQTIKTILPLKGTRVAFGCEDGEIKIYKFLDEARDKREEEKKKKKEEKKEEEEEQDLFQMDDESIYVCHWEAHKDWVNYLTLLPDEKIVSCSKDGKIRFWVKKNEDEYDKNFEKELTHHVEEENVEQADSDKENEEKEAPHDKKPNTNLLNVVKVIPISKNRLASCSWDKTIKVFSLDNFNAVTLKHDGIVNSIIQLQNKEVLVSSSDDMTVRFWNLEDNSEIGRIEGILNTNKESLNQVDENNLLVSNCLGREIIIISLTDNRFAKIGTILMDNLCFNTHAITMTIEKIIMCAGDDGALCKIDFSKKRVVNVKWDNKATFITCIGQLKGIEKVLVTGDTTGFAKFWKY